METIEKLITLIDESVEKDPDKNKQVEVKAFKRLEEHLKEIPSILYFNPIFINKFIGEIKPDILWLYPKMGLLVIEVKAWDKDFIEKLSFKNDRFYYKSYSYQNPIKEANRFKEKLMNYIKKKMKNLPIGIEYIVYFPQITRKEYRKLQNEKFKYLIPEECCIFKQDSYIKQKLVDRLSNNYKIKVKEEEILKLRRILFPQLTIAKFENRIKEEEIPLMDIQQEKLLYRYSKGIRILRGTAGSGKTIVLIGKAIQEKAKNKEKKVLLLTFTNSLVSEIKNNIESLLKLQEIEDLKIDDFEIKTVDSLIHELTCKYVKEISEDTKKAFIKLLEKKPDLLKEEDKYDVILCDESQDFNKNFFKVIKALRKENSLLIFGVDETQRIYDGTDWKWTDVGIDAKGKVIVLKKSYRNPGKIFKLALEFLKKDKKLMNELKELQAVVTEDGVESIRKDEGKIDYQETDNEFKKVAEIINQLLQKGKKPEDIFILIPLSVQAKRFYEEVVQSNPEIKDRISYFSYSSPKKFKKIPKEKLVIMPYKSAKGLERPIVIVSGVSNLPYKSSKRAKDKRRDRRTLYVALTRAQKELIITSYKKKESEFTKDIKDICSKIKTVK